MKAHNFLFIILALVAIIIVIVLPGTDRRTIHPMTNELAVEPDHMILNATHYTDGDEDLSKINYIERAIGAMRLIEKDADSLSNQVIEAAIKDLKSVEEELRRHELNHDHLNHAFQNALNSLAFAQLRVSEVYRKKGEHTHSNLAMGYAIRHLQNAVQFSRAHQSDNEIHLYKALDSLVVNKSLSDNEVIAKMDEVLAELDTMVMH